MTSFSELESPKALDVGAVFEALCRVQEHGRAEDGPEAALLRLSKELALPANEQSAAPVVNEAAAEDDDLPDFSAIVRPRERARSATQVEDRDALLEQLASTLESYRAVLDRYRADFDEAVRRRATGMDEPADATVARLREAQAVLVKYPVAAQAAFAALVREGRRFATTDEGKLWRRRLEGSALLARARTLFEGLTAGMVAEDAGALPSAYVDAFLRAMDNGLEEMLATLGGAEP